MQLRVFADEDGQLHLEISSPALVYSRGLFVPMLASSASLLQAVEPGALVNVWHEGSTFQVPYLLVHSKEKSLTNWKSVGVLEENDSRNVLNHILDILAWD